jgi:hypothetical protein
MGYSPWKPKPLAMFLAAVELRFLWADEGGRLDAGSPAGEGWGLSV